MSLIQITLPCTRAEAVAAQALDDPFPWLEDPPALVAAETPDGWALMLWLDAPPDARLLAAIRAFAPSAASAASISEIDEQDWLTLSQAGLEPVNAGRFHIHTSDHPGQARPGQISFRIDAGLAFGTAHHPTTAGCLAAIDRLARRRRFSNVLDLGTGSGLLAFAAARVWRRARVTGSDIDATAVRVAQDNARLNGLRPGRGPGSVHLLAAPGLEHHDLAARAPYDLLIANILAGPLLALAPGLCGALAPGGILMLAGLINPQARKLVAAYRARGLRLLRPVGGAEWPVLLFTAPAGNRLSRAARGTAGARPTASEW
ncbi:50S ribosomal protein L11 methyltransferase [Sandaracinobacteroides saxicola]|uniref:50S ribosomal protein L11 methyltransferase n=1 Tax=Sandaracinobacteroides saxicola TaxID=2759707 RepID=UPI001FB122E4|nr:50S ribosomal protein L11 methyltransferase [Sandaracinobacteroides saxicola]